MIRKMLRAGLAAAALGVALPAAAQEAHVEDVDFSFEGPFGRFDQHQLQRGLQVFQEVCSTCHGLSLLAFRNLGDPGGPELPEDQVKALAALYEVTDAETGEPRPAISSDKFPPVTAQGAPDLTLMAKARAGFHGPMGTGLTPLLRGNGGPEFIVSLLTGYTGNEKEEAGETYYENTAFPGGWIKMPPPLTDDQVSYRDGHAADVHHMSEDVAAFLMWTAEPKLMARKEAGLTAVIFLAFLAVLLYYTNKKLWAPIKRQA
ncbi:MAG TPA: cytochrome c1 [Paracoccaceae bacterium]|nr:cytochrome c1 [Paracoccaceae bacterium]